MLDSNGHNEHIERQFENLAPAIAAALPPPFHVDACRQWQDSQRLMLAAVLDIQLTWLKLGMRLHPLWRPLLPTQS